MRFVKFVAVASLLALSSASAALADPPTDKSAKPEATKPAADKPDVATLLFGNPQWGKAPAGTVITYAFAKKGTDPAFGPSFDDTIKMTLGAGDDAESRTAEVQMFSGANRRPAGPFRSDKQNPVLLVVLEENVQELSKLFKANPRYLKNAIRRAWRDNAKIEKTDVTVGGKTMPGTRISIAPFVGDEQAGNMKGLDGMVYIVEVADDAPGNLVTVDIHAPADGPAKFSEILHLQSDKLP